MTIAFITKPKSFIRNQLLGQGQCFLEKNLDLNKTKQKRPKTRGKRKTQSGNIKYSYIFLGQLISTFFGIFFCFCVFTFILFIFFQKTKQKNEQKTGLKRNTLTQQGNIKFLYSYDN